MRQSEKLALIGELSAGVFHEIKNPLTSIKGFLQLMQAGTIKTTEYITILNAEINRIEQIANDLLGFAKPNENMEAQDIAKVIDEVVLLLKTSLKDKNIKINWNPVKAKMLVLGDRSQLKQVFLNLIKNAIEASKFNGMIEVSLVKENSRIVVKVKDFGCGIPHNQLHKVGESFFTTKQQGTGLGLMVTHKIVENHSGKIEIESQVNKGTTFHVIFPR